MIEQNILIAFWFTLFAWLATWIWSLLAYFTKSTNTKLLSLSLWFSAWVMIYVSFMEIFPKAQESIVTQVSENLWTRITVLSFFAWIFVIWIIDKLIPSYENPHEVYNIEEMDDRKKRWLFRMWVFSAIAITIHNLPEWMATFAATLSDPTVWLTIAIATAIHNIPEWIAISIPIYYATWNRLKALTFWTLSWLAEPVWALLIFLLLWPYLNEMLFWIIFSMVAGIMVFISLDELLPAAQKYWHHHLSIYWLIAWMIIMALSLLLLW